MLKNVRTKGIPSFPEVDSKGVELEVGSPPPSSGYQVIFVVNNQMCIAEVSSDNNEILAVGKVPAFAVPPPDFGLFEVTIELFILRKSDNKVFLLSSEEMNHSGHGGLCLRLGCPAWVVYLNAPSCFNSPSRPVTVRRGA